MSVHRCAQLLRSGDPDKFLATIIAPRHLRPILFTIFAFHYEISKIPYSTKEELLAEIKFKWWEEELINIKNNNHNRTRNEILNPLSDLIISKKIPIDLFLASIKARRFDLGNQPHLNVRDQLDYIENIFSSLLEVALRSCANNLSAESVLCVRKYGLVLGVANLLLALPALELMGKKPLFLNQHKKEDLSLSKKDQTDKDEEFSERVRTLVVLANSALQDARKNLRFVDNKLRPILFCCCSVPIILNKAYKNPSRVKMNTLKLSPVYKLINLFRVRIVNRI